MFAGDNEPDAFDEAVDGGEEVVEGRFGDFAAREDDEDAWARGLAGGDAGKAGWSVPRNTRRMLLMSPISA